MPDVDLHELLKKYMNRVGEHEGVYFLYDDVPNANGEDPPFTKEELAVLHEVIDELSNA